MCDPQTKQIDDLVAMLDNMMSSGTGHINVKVEEEDGTAVIETTNSTECSLGTGACAQPTAPYTDED